MPNIETKYAAAAQEISARIQARNRTLLAFYSLTAVICGIAVQGNGNAILGVSLSYAALVSVLVSVYHERTIEHLLRFQNALEQSDPMNVGPDWVSSEHYGRTLNIRVLRDLGQAFAFAVGAGTPLVLIDDRWNTYPKLYRESYSVAWWAALGCIILAECIILWEIIRKNFRPGVTG
jgi:hypothetical protein